MTMEAEMTQRTNTGLHRWLRQVGRLERRGASLRRKVMLVVLSTTALALVLSAAALLLYELRVYRQTRITDLQTQADLIAGATAPALSFNDPAIALENLRMLGLRPQITAAALYRPSGAVFATYAQTPEVAADLPRSVLASGHLISGDKLELFQPVRQNGEWLGTLYLRTDYDITRRLIDYVLILLAVMGASLLAAALIMARLQRAVTDPILRVAQVARDVMTRGDFTLRAPKTSNDEVGELVDAFNLMLAEVGARTTALEQSNRHLSVEMAERRRAEEAVRAAARKKDEFLATMAHELRNPLAPISNAIEILRRLGHHDVPLRERALDIMGRQVRQLVRLIDDLLDVSRITTGKLMLRCEGIDLVRVLLGALETASPLLERRRQHLRTVLPHEPVYVQGDAARLSQVFGNLLNNAAKYTDEGGHIDLTLTRRDQEVVVSVSDDGIGIAPEMQEAIFTMFMQVDQALDRGKAGLGVGLSLARQLVVLHGGRLEVYSEGLGRGTTFSVYLPAGSGPGQGPVLAHPAGTPGPRGALRVLVADDNVDFANSLCSLLTALGHDVAVAHDGRAALEQAQASPPDIALLDIGMPHLSGHELARQLRDDARTRDCTLVAITGWSQREDRLRSQTSGFDHHLVKPVDLVQLQPILDTVARRPD